MIMNSDRASGTRSPFGLFTEYQQYKKNTAVVLDWLIDNGGLYCKKDHTLVSVRQMSTSTLSPEIPRSDLVTTTQ